MEDLDRWRQLTRRTFLASSTALALTAQAGAERRAAELIVRGRDPDNLEFPFDSLDSFLTPNKLFYVRSHFPVPKVAIRDWRLRVEGAVARPLELHFDDLLALPAATRPMTLECAGNGRLFLTPKIAGVQWGLGAVSTAEWTGVSLAAVLEKAGVKRSAVEVVLEGADRGQPKNEPKPRGAISFARSLPIAKALSDSVLLAYKMGGVELPVEHGFPLRAVVGGWYGMASVKWLARIIVTERAFLGYDQTTDYGIWEKRDGLPQLVPITENAVKASIARPSAGERVPAGQPYRIHGAAWAGEADVAQVEVSVDGGKHWAAARLLGKPIALCWRLWEYTWAAPRAGPHTLLVRATDSRGNTQPRERDTDRRSYMINHIVATPVEVG